METYGNKVSFSPWENDETDNPTACRGIALNSQSRYNACMRKKRTDRNHLIYRLTCLDTGEEYVGLTVMRGRAQQKTLATRWQQHQYRAHNQDKDWALSRAIRKYQNWTGEVLAVVRGKAIAHAYETDIINSERPALNTFMAG